MASPGACGGRTRRPDPCPRSSFRAKFTQWCITCNAPPRLAASRRTPSKDTERMRPNSLEARDVHSVIHGLTNLQHHQERGPLLIDRGRGVWVTDIDGKEYIEAMSGLWCISLGYGQERLVEAAAAQMRKLPYYHL